MAHIWGKCLPEPCCIIYAFEMCSFSFANCWHEQSLDRCTDFSIISPVKSLASSHGFKWNSQHSLAVEFKLLDRLISDAKCEWQAGRQAGSSQHSALCSRVSFSLIPAPGPWSLAAKSNFLYLVAKQLKNLTLAWQNIFIKNSTKISKCQR